LIGAGLDFGERAAERRQAMGRVAFSGAAANPSRASLQKCPTRLEVEPRRDLVEFAAGERLLAAPNAMPAGAEGGLGWCCAPVYLDEASIRWYEYISNVEVDCVLGPVCSKRDPSNHHR
jgi:hypothetical protein